MDIFLFYPILFNNPVDFIQYQYELCYRCHTDSPNMPSSKTARHLEQNDLRLEFDLSGPSYHPVVGSGKNPDVPSLIGSAYTESSVIYCTDCHAGDDAGAPAGPHGSSYPSILKYRYEKADYTAESVSNYELCYSCHDRESILGDNSFPYHDKHIRDEETPCNACHDPHGINSPQGNSTNNSHLINFDISIVSTVGPVTRRFVDTGLNSGYCQLKCHNKTHTLMMNY